MIYYGNELCHFRTPDSKNGQRLYQYRDGTGTPLGLERRRQQYAQTVASLKRGKKYRTNYNRTIIKEPNIKDYAPQYDKNGNLVEPMNKFKVAAQLGDLTGKNVGYTKNVVETLRPRDNNVIDLSDMSDNELKGLIDRMQLEKSYEELNSNYIESGEDKVSRVLSVVGDIVGLTSGVASIAYVISQLVKNSKIEA